MTQNTIRIRSFEQKDIHGLRFLMTYLGYEREKNTLEKDLNFFLENHLNQIYMAIIEDKPVGYIALALHPLLVTSYYRCRIENLVVHPDFRRQGIARALVKASQTYAIECNASLIDVTSSEERKVAHLFYKKFGFNNDENEKRTYFRKRLIFNNEKIK